MIKIEKSTLDRAECHLTIMAILIGLCCLALFITGMSFIINAMETNSVAKLVFGIFIWIACVAVGYWAYKIGKVDCMVGDAKYKSE